MSSPAPLKLNLGCGDIRIPGYLGVDIQEKNAADIIDDVATLSQFGDGTADEIYACHILEHFGRHHYMDVLRTWWRVLRNEGVLRVAVPDFGACFLHYQERGLDELIGLLYGGQRDEYDFHQIVFDQTTLTKALNNAGFADVQPWNWRNTAHAHIDDYSQAYLPHLDKEHGRLMSLNLKAVKVHTTFK